MFKRLRRIDPRDLPSGAAAPDFNAGGSARHPEVVFQLLTAVARAQAQGRDGLVRRYGFPRRLAEQIARLPGNQLHRLTHPGLALFDVQVDPAALDTMLERHLERVRERRLQDRLLALGAPAEMMRRLFGWSARDCARRRRELDLTGLDTGRPRRPTRAEAQAVWRAWRDYYGLAPAERFEAVASATGLKLNVVWSLTRHWLDDDTPPRRGRPNEEAGGDGEPPTLPKRLRAWWRRLTERPDPEHQQALVRVGVAAGLFAYVWSARDWPGGTVHPEPLWEAVLAWAGTLSIVTALGIVAAIVRWPQALIWRRYLALALDILMVSFYLWYQGAFGALQYVVLLWLVFGHGVRFGQRHLIAASLLATAAFLLVTASHPFWRPLGVLPYCLAVGLLVLPVWIHVLLRNRTRSLRRLQAERLGQGEAQAATALAPRRRR